jgi:hypothetical protein
MKGIEFAASLSVAEVEPVGHFVRGPKEARLLEEGLQQHRTIAVGAAPIIAEAASDQASAREARLRQLTHGRIRKRALLTIKWSLARRWVAFQPMKSSGLAAQP